MNRFLVAVCGCLFVCLGLAAAVEPGWKPVPNHDRSGWSQACAIKWLATCGTPHEDWINRIIETRDGSIVAAGFVDRDDTAKKPDWNAVALRLTADGRIDWGRSFGGPETEAAWAVRELASDGRLVAGGFSGSHSLGDWDAWLAFPSRRRISRERKPLRRSKERSRDRRARDTRR